MLPHMSHSIEITLEGFRRLRSMLMEPPVLFARALVTETIVWCTITPPATVLMCMLCYTLQIPVEEECNS